MVKAVTAPFYPAARCAPPRRPRVGGDPGQCLQRAWAKVGRTVIDSGRHAPWPTLDSRLRGNDGSGGAGDGEGGYRAFLPPLPLAPHRVVPA